MTTRNTSRPNTPTEQNKEDNQLVLYRLEMVEKAVKAVGEKFDRQDNIKKGDLVEFRDSLLSRIAEIRAAQQDDINELKNNKADRQQVDDLKTRMNAIGAGITSVVIALTIYFFTKLASL